jgi:hypothetical protein
MSARIRTDVFVIITRRLWFQHKSCARAGSKVRYCA